MHTSHILQTLLSLYMGGMCTEIILDRMSKLHTMLKTCETAVISNPQCNTSNDWRMLKSQLRLYLYLTCQCIRLEKMDIV